MYTVLLVECDSQQRVATRFELGRILKKAWEKSGISVLEVRVDAVLGEQQLDHRLVSFLCCLR